MQWNEEDYATVPLKYRAKLKSAAKQVLVSINFDTFLHLALALSQVIQSVLGPIAIELGKSPEWVSQHPIVTLYLAKMVQLNYPGEEDGSLRANKESILKLVHEWAKQ